MRTLLTLTASEPASLRNNLTPLENWLLQHEYHPVRVEFTEEESRIILGHSDTHQMPQILERMQKEKRQAAEMLLTIPKDNDERELALSQAKFSIRYAGNHGVAVWGLVCVDLPKVIIRWRHRVGRALEGATEAFVASVFSQDETGVFKPMGPTEIIPVREPLTTDDAYTGSVIPPGPHTKSLARRQRSIEIKVGLCAVIFFCAFLVLGGIVAWFAVDSPMLHWLGGVLDRFASAALITAIVTGLNYMFHLRSLRQKPIIDWQ